jgi:hypothetical protein
MSAQYATQPELNLTNKSYLSLSLNATAKVSGLPVDGKQKRPGRFRPGRYQTQTLTPKLSRYWTLHAPVSPKLR